ncbi:tripartite tricarboxylate transporter substrate binding protein [Clostridium sp. AM58-1XD]|nr:tripartite tricarboxylate transporter substrate binding protein [Clostridium sp. AM58-1XD]
MGLTVAALGGCGSSGGGKAESTAPAAETTEAKGSSDTAESADGAQAAETSWPERTIEMVVPFKAGGDTDFYARTYAKYLEKELGQTVTIINTEGAGGTVGAQSVADAKNDGYKILFYHTGNMYTNKLLGATDLDQNSFDIACIGVVDNTNVLCARKNLGITDAADFLEKAKAEPGKYSCATTISGFSYFTLCKMEKTGGFEVNPVDAGGASAMIPALLGDQVDLAVNSYGVFKQYIDNGDIIPLMTTGKERNENFPDVPTSTELGMTDSDAERAYFIAFPKGTDSAILQKMSDAVANIQKNEDYVKDISEAYFVEPAFVPYEEVQTYMDDMWAQMEPYKDAMGQ